MATHWVGEAADRASRLHALNARVRQLAVAFGPDADFVCECGCFELVRLTIEEYDALNGAPVYCDGHPRRSLAA